jgi:hypothetical protein
VFVAVTDSMNSACPHEERSEWPREALPYTKRIYRMPLSRGMKRCSIICVDDETRDFLESRILV